jgi:hypothetical protein
LSGIDRDVAAVRVAVGRVEPGLWWVGGWVSG